MACVLSGVGPYGTMRQGVIGQCLRPNVSSLVKVLLINLEWPSTEGTAEERVRLILRAIKLSYIPAEETVRLR